MILFIKKAEVT